MNFAQNNDLARYNPFKDAHLSTYFSSPAMRKRLRHAGLLSKDGKTVSDGELKRRATQRERLTRARQLFATETVSRHRDFELGRQLELQKQLQAVRNVESYRQIKGDDSIRDSDLVKIRPKQLEKSLARTKSTPPRAVDEAASLPEAGKGGEGGLQAMRSSGYFTDDEGVTRRRSASPPHVDRAKRRHVFRYLDDVYRYQYLHKLNSSSLKSYANYLRRELNQIERLREALPLISSESSVVSSTSSGRWMHRRSSTPRLPPHTPSHAATARRSVRTASMTRKVSKRTRALRRLASAPEQLADRARSLSPKRAFPPISNNKRAANVTSRLYIKSAGGKRAPKTQPCACFLEYLGPRHSKTSEMVATDFPKSYSIVIQQQHCEGQPIIVFKEELEPGAKFYFFSFRHAGYPFTLNLLEDGEVVGRVSACCECRYEAKTRLGGTKGTFRWLGVRAAHPCYRCQAHRSLEAPFTNYVPKNQVLLNRVREKERMLWQEQRPLRPSTTLPMALSRPPKTAPPIESQSSVTVKRQMRAKRVQNKMRTQRLERRQFWPSGLQAAEASQADSSVKSKSSKPRKSSKQAKANADRNGKSNGLVDEENVIKTAISLSLSSNSSDSESETEREERVPPADMEEEGLSSSSSSTSSASSRDDKSSLKETTTFSKSPPANKVETLAVVEAASTSKQNGPSTSRRSSSESTISSSRRSGNSANNEQPDEWRLPAAPEWLTPILNKEAEENGQIVEPTNSTNETEAATKIQSVFRGHRTRKEKAAEKQEKTAKHEEAATKIQAAFRGYRVRKERDAKKREQAERAALAARPGSFATVRSRSPDSSSSDSSTPTVAAKPTNNQENEEDDFATRLKSASSTLLELEKRFFGDEKEPGELSKSKSTTKDDSSTSESPAPQARKKRKQRNAVVDAEVVDEKGKTSKKAAEEAGSSKAKAKGAEDANQTGEWVCGVCNFENPPFYEHCRICQAERDAAVSSGQSSPRHSQHSQHSQHSNTASATSRSSSSGGSSSAESVPSERHGWPDARRSSGGDGDASGVEEAGHKSDDDRDTLADAQSIGSVEETRGAAQLEVGVGQPQIQVVPATPSPNSPSFKQQPPPALLLADEEKSTLSDVSAADRILKNHSSSDNADNQTDNTMAESKVSAMPEVEEDVALGGTDLSNEEAAARVAEDLAANAHLKSVSLRSTRLTDVSLHTIAQAMDANHAPLRVLNLNDNQLTEASVADILQLVWQRPIEILMLHENKLGDIGVAKLLDGLSMMIVGMPDCRLRRIDIGETQMGDAAAESLGRLLSQSTTLQSVNVGGNKAISAEGWTALANGLAQNASLHSLSLDYCSMGDQPVTVLCDKLKGKQALRFLDFDGNGLTDRGAGALIEMARTCPSLDNVVLMAGNGVSTERAHALRQVLGSKRQGVDPQQHLSIQPRHFIK